MKKAIKTMKKKVNRKLNKWLQNPRNVNLVILIILLFCGYVILSPAQIHEKVFAVIGIIICSAFLFKIDFLLSIFTRIVDSFNEIDIAEYHKRLYKAFKLTIFAVLTSMIIIRFSENAAEIFYFIGFLLIIFYIVYSFIVLLMRMQSYAFKPYKIGINNDRGKQFKTTKLTDISLTTNEPNTQAPLLSEIFAPNKPLKYVKIFKLIELYCFKNPLEDNQKTVWYNLIVKLTNGKRKSIKNIYNNTDSTSLYDEIDSILIILNPKDTQTVPNLSKYYDISLKVVEYITQESFKIPQHKIDECIILLTSYIILIKEGEFSPSLDKKFDLITRTNVKTCLNKIKEI